MSSPDPNEQAVLAISGAIGSGKASLAAAIGEALGCLPASFGKQVRREVEAGGGDPSDYTTLQQIGQALVLGDLQGFVARTLAQQPGTSVVSGVRHWEVLDEMRRQLAPRRVVLVHLQTSLARRERRFIAELGANRRQMGSWDNNINEAQIARVLPQYAHVTLDGDLPVRLLVAKLHVLGLLPSARG